MKKTILCQAKEKTRLRIYLVGKWDLLPSSSSIKKAIKRKEIKVNGTVADSNTYVEKGDAILCTKSQKVPYDPSINIPIVYEDEYLAVVEKPAGLLTSGNRGKTLQNALFYALHWDRESGYPPKVIHRLDRATSGLIIVAKTHQAYQLLQGQMRDGRIEKKYVALVHGKLPPCLDIRFMIDGKSAQSIAETVQVMEHPKTGMISLVNITLKTGRTHQIRKHFSALGHPILGDKLYNETISRGFRGLFLVANELSFRHPKNRKKILVQVNLPKKFIYLLT